MQLLKVNESQYIALLVVSESIKKLFSFVCVNIYHSSTFISTEFLPGREVWNYPRLLTSWFINFNMKCKLSAFINNTIVYMHYEHTCTNALLACSKLEHTFKYTIKQNFLKPYYTWKKRAELNGKVESAISGCSTTVHFCNTLILCLWSRIIKVSIKVFTSWIFLHRYFYRIVMVIEQLEWRKILRSCIRSYGCAYWMLSWKCIALNLYGTSLSGLCMIFLLHCDSKLKHMVRLPSKKAYRVLEMYSGAIW